MPNRPESEYEALKAVAWKTTSGHMTLGDKTPCISSVTLEQLWGPTHIKRLRGGFGNPLAHFASDVGASLYVWPGSQNSLQHTEGVGFCAAHYTTLARNQRVDEVVVVLRPQLAYTCTTTLIQEYSKYSQGV